MIPLAVILALVAAFFLGSRFSYIPHQTVSASDETFEWLYLPKRPVEVWVSKDKIFVWEHEIPRPIEQLPARIREYRAKHQANVAKISAEDLTRFEDVVYVLTELRKAGFSYLTVETHGEPIPELARK